MWLSFAFLSDRIGSRWFDISLLQKLSGKSVWKILCASVQFGCQAVWFSVILHRWCWVPSCFHSTEQVLMQFIPVPSLAFWTTSGSLPASCCPHVTSFLLLSQRLGLSFARNLKSGVLQCPRTALSHKLWNFGPESERISRIIRIVGRSQWYGRYGSDLRFEIWFHIHSIYIPYDSMSKMREQDLGGWTRNVWTQEWSAQAGESWLSRSSSSSTSEAKNEGAAMCCGICGNAPAAVSTSAIEVQSECRMTDSRDFPHSHFYILQWAEASGV